MTGGAVEPERSVRSAAVVVEFVGTLFLLAGVVGSGIMAQRLSSDPGVQLFINAVATGGVLLALILSLQDASGAHFNPAVTLADRWLGGIDSRTAAAYVAAQLVGGGLGVVVANVMFELDPVVVAETQRSGGHLFVSEVVATVGLLLVIFGVVRSGHPRLAAGSVAGYITGAYFFTSSTSFANPAVTVARTLSDSFAGIDPVSAPAFVVAQLLGVVVAVPLVGVLYPSDRATP